MRLDGIREECIDWSIEPAVRVDGEISHSISRARRAHDIQQRIVDYAPGYLADHWCAKGHVMYVISGALTIEHEDGSPPLQVRAGMSWCVGDDERPAHRVRCAKGAQVFIVD